MEEAREAQGASQADLLAELADVLEVLRALTEQLGMTWKQFTTMAGHKRVQRGGFRNRVFLEYVDRST